MKLAIALCVCAVLGWCFLLVVQLSLGLYALHTDWYWTYSFYQKVAVIIWSLVSIVCVSWLAWKLWEPEIRSSRKESA